MSVRGEGEGGGREPAQSVERRAPRRRAAAQTGAAYGVQRAVGAVVSSRAKLGWSRFGRTGEDVPLHATGPGSERLRGSMDNSELGRRIERIMGWDLDKLTAGLAPPAISQLDRDDPVTAGFSSWL